MLKNNKVSSKETIKNALFHISNIGKSLMKFIKTPFDKAILSLEFDNKQLSRSFPGEFDYLDRGKASFYIISLIVFEMIVFQSFTSFLLFNVVVGTVYLYRRSWLSSVFKATFDSKVTKESIINSSRVFLLDNDIKHSDLKIRIFKYIRAEQKYDGLLALQLFLDLNDAVCLSEIESEINGHDFNTIFDQIDAKKEDEEHQTNLKRIALEKRISSEEKIANQERIDKEERLRIDKIEKEHIANEKIIADKEKERLAKEEMDRITSEKVAIKEKEKERIETIKTSEKSLVSKEDETTIPRHKDDEKPSIETTAHETNDKVKEKEKIASEIAVKPLSYGKQSREQSGTLEKEKLKEKTEEALDLSDFDSMLPDDAEYMEFEPVDAIESDDYDLDGLEIVEEDYHQS
jgi:hypothetical protein